MTQDALNLTPLNLRDPVAVFPLPGVVFFPSTALPLHIFEPRYREMTAWCLEREPEQLGDPPFEAIAGLGEIVQHDKLDDGRYTLVLRGAARVRLTEIDCDTPFRQAMAEVIPDELAADRAALEGHVESLEALGVGLSAYWPRGAQMVARLLNQTRDPAVLSNCLGSALWRDPEERQALLACPDVDARMQRVVDRLARVLADVGSASGVAN
jgi:Lon protease-like protein